MVACEMMEEYYVWRILPAYTTSVCMNKQKVKHTALCVCVCVCDVHKNILQKIQYRELKQSVYTNV